VQAGNSYVSPTLESVWERLQEKPPTADPIEALTSREREVYQLIIAGNTNRGIGERLGISIRTVEVHRKNIMAKLGIKNLTQLIQFASRNNLHISPGNT
ncbi:MAG: response regulator transcription factor, partial [Chloroflexi bacterium]|nr:response regulator transcription factor [Chloroflexota bacterium]